MFSFSLIRMWFSWWKMIRDQWCSFIIAVFPALNFYWKRNIPIISFKMKRRVTISCWKANRRNVAITLRGQGIFWWRPSVCEWAACWIFCFWSPCHELHGSFLRLWSTNHLVHPWVAGSGQVSCPPWKNTSIYIKLVPRGEIMVVWAVELIPALDCIYIYIFGCQEWLACAMNPVGGGVGLGLHVSAGHKTNSVSWLASLTPPFNKS